MICGAIHRCKWVSGLAFRIRVTFSGICSHIRADDTNFAANPLRAVDEKKVCGLNFGIQFNVILPAAPGVSRIVQQIVHLILIAFHPPEFLNRHTNE